MAKTLTDTADFTHADIPWTVDPMSYLAPVRELTAKEEALRDALVIDLAYWTPEQLAGALIDLILDVQGLTLTLHASLDVIQQQQRRLTRATTLIERQFVSRSED